MSKDITGIISGWEFEPDKVNVRIVRGDDSRDKIQMRLDMGLMQMNFDGRPDGFRPEECESWLEYYRKQQQAHDAANPDGKPFLLESVDCARLMREGVQYYHRYLSFWHLNRYELCARDTNRNLRLFAFVREHARHEHEKLQFDQYRPYVTMMHTRAVATPLVELRQLESAIGAIDAGIRAIKDFLVEYQQMNRADQCGELLHLARWREELSGKLPPQPPAVETSTEPAANDIPPAMNAGPNKIESPPSNLVAELRGELDRAIAEERFEDAIALRDRIAQATKHGSGNP